MGATFIAALEVIIYAGAIMVLFVFVVMMLNLGAPATAQEQQWLRPQTWIRPGLLCAALMAELIYIFVCRTGSSPGVQVVEPKAVGIALFGPYLLGVELASMLLLAGLVGAYHLGHRDIQKEPGKGGV